MKVLKEAEDNDELWNTQETCTGKGWEQSDGRTPCGRLLEINAQDIQHRDHNYMGRGNERYYGFTCIKCGCFTELDKKDIPDSIMNNSKEYYKPSKD